MKSKTTLLLLLLSLICMAAARMECPGVPSMTPEAACRKACATELMYGACMDTLRGAGAGVPSSSPQEATVYAILAARRAVDSYDTTAAATSAKLQRNPSLSGDEREAYVGCLHDYAAAQNSMSLVADGMLSNCYLARLSDEYRNGMTSLESCRDRLLAPWLHGASPLYAMVMADRNEALLAYLLGKLLGSSNA